MKDRRIINMKTTYTYGSSVSIYLIRITIKINLLTNLKLNNIGWEVAIMNNVHFIHISISFYQDWHDSTIFIV